MHTFLVLAISFLALAFGACTPTGREPIRQTAAASWFDAGTCASDADCPGGRCIGTDEDGPECVPSTVGQPCAYDAQCSQPWEWCDDGNACALRTGDGDPCPEAHALAPLSPEAQRPCGAGTTCAICAPIFPPEVSAECHGAVAACVPIVDVCAYLDTCAGPCLDEAAWCTL